MENNLTIYQKIQKARVMLQARNLKKSGKNTFSKYEYFELSDFLPHINEILNELNLFSMCDINDTVGILTIFDAEDPQKFIQFTMPSASMEVKGANSIQNLGAIQTYIRRYLYMLAFEISETDAIDLEEDKNEKSGKQKDNKPELNKEFEELMKKTLDVKESLKSEGKLKEANAIISEKAQTPNIKRITNLEDLQYVYDKLNEIK